MSTSIVNADQISARLLDIEARTRMLLADVAAIASECWIGGLPDTAKRRTSAQCDFQAAVESVHSAGRTLNGEP